MSDLCKRNVEDNRKVASHLSELSFVIGTRCQERIGLGVGYNVVDEVVPTCIALITVALNNIRASPLYF